MVLPSIQIRRRLMLVLILVSGAASADVFTELPLKVNVLPGNAQTNAQISTLVDGVNDIFARCGRIAFTTAKVNRLAALPAGFAPVGGGNTVLAGGGNPAKAAQDAAANPEIKNGGYKIFLASALQNPGGNATNGATWLGNGSSLVTQQAGVNGDQQTWAHEIAHGLGIGHLGNAPVTNLMFPFRTDANGVAAGSDLTEAQCRQIIAAYLRRQPLVEVTVDQLGLIPERRDRSSVLASALPVDPGQGTPVAGFDWLAPHQITVLFRDDLAATVEFTLDLRAALPRIGDVEARFDIPVDVDSDLTTGVRVGASNGVDAVVSIRLSGAWPFEAPRGSRSARLTPTSDDAATVFLRPPEILPRVQFADAITAPDPVRDIPLQPFNDSLRISLLQKSLGELADAIRVGVESSTLGAVVSVPPQSIPTRVPRPALNAAQRSVLAGADVPLTGSGFNAGGSVTLFFGDDLSNPIGSAPVDDRGQFSARITVPMDAWGDRLVDAVDDAGGIGITVLKIQPAVTGMQPGLVLLLAVIAALIGALIAFLLSRRSRSD